MHCPKLYGLVVLMFLAAPGFRAQDTLSSAQVEEKSYALFLAKDWNALESFGKKALAAGNDYYYLRLRMGIAYFSESDYLLAEHQFQKALAFNTADPLAMEYLYFVYVYTGQYEEARKLSLLFPNEMSVRLGTDKLSPVGFVSLEGKTSVTNDAERIHYYQAGLGHSIKDRISLFHAVTYYTQDDNTASLKQFQYYIKAAIPIAQTWVLSGAVHLLNRDLTPRPQIDSVWFYPKPPPPNPQNPHPMNPPPIRELQLGPPPPTQTTNFIVYSAQLKKTVNRFECILGSSVSNFGNEAQINHNLGLTWYPFGNARVSVNCTGYVYTSDLYSTLQTAVVPSITVLPYKTFCVSASYLTCNGSNLVESNGYLVNNLPDALVSRWSFLAAVPLGKHFAAYAVYQVEDKLSAANNSPYSSNLILIGVKIKP